MKILVTGGHLTPALALIDYATSVRTDISFAFIGRLFAQDREKIVAREKIECEKRGIPFYSITAGKVHRSVPYRNLFEIPKFLSSFFQARTVLQKEKPDLVLSFGGYLAVPVAIIAHLYKIPVITHEQTATLGLANSFISLFAEKLALSIPIETTRKNTVVTGNPVRTTFLEKQAAKPRWIKKRSRKPMIYITGGSQGSFVINQVVRSTLDQLTSFAMVVHQCGSSRGNRYLNELESAASLLPALQRSRYLVREWVDEKDAAWLMQNSVVVVARSGANTVFELQLSSAPAIFIPLPFAHANEQVKNAERLVRAGSALMIQQKQLTGEVFVRTVRTALRRQISLKRKADLLRSEVIDNGAERLLTECVKLVNA